MAVVLLDPEQHLQGGVTQRARQLGGSARVAAWFAKLNDDVGD
jgi:hypothetical protein